MIDASPDDSSRVEQPSTVPDGVSALGSLDKRRVTDELRDWNLRLAEPADEKVREVERLNMLRCFVTAQLAEIAEPEEMMDVFREFHHAVGVATCGEADFTCLSCPVPTFEFTSLPDRVKVMDPS